MTPEDIVEKFAHSLDNFEPIDRQPSDTDLTRLREAVASLLLQIPNEETGAVHNLIGLIRPEAAYVARCSESFPNTTRVGAYDSTIDNDATSVFRVRSEAAHKAKRVDRATYEMERQETTQFVLAVVADTWVRKLSDSDSLYTKVAPKYIFAHFQAGCTGWHALKLLALHNEMQHYHLKFEGTPEYINMLEDAQRQAGREGITIADKTLLLFSSTDTLTCEHVRARKKDQGLVGDRFFCPAGLPLRVLEHVNVLGDSLNLEVVALHFVMQHQEVKGVPDDAPHLEV